MDGIGRRAARKLTHAEHRCYISATRRDREALCGAEAGRGQGDQFPFGTGTTIDRRFQHCSPNILWSSLAFSLDNFSACSDTSLPDSAIRSLANPSSADERTGQLTGFNQQFGGNLPTVARLSATQGVLGSWPLKELAKAGLFQFISFGSYGAGDRLRVPLRYVLPGRPFRFLRDTHERRVCGFGVKY